MGSTRLIDFPFSTSAYFQKKKKVWRFTVKNPAHNHTPSLYAAAHTTNRKLTPSLYDKMKKLGDAGLKPAAILEAMKKTHPTENILATVSTIDACRRKAQLESLQGLSPISHLNQTLRGTDFTTATKVNDEGTLKALFFCHT